MVILMNKGSVRKPRNVFVAPEALHKARIEGLRVRKPLGQWLEEVIDEKAAGEEETKHS